MAVWMARRTDGRTDGQRDRHTDRQIDREIISPVSVATQASQRVEIDTEEHECCRIDSRFQPGVD